MTNDDDLRRLKERTEVRRGKLSLADRDAMIREYIDGATMDEVGRRFGVSQQTVSYHVKRLLNGKAAT